MGCVYALLQGGGNVGYNFRTQYDIDPTDQIFCLQVQTQRLWLYQAGVLTAKSRICTVGPSQADGG